MTSHAKTPRPAMPRERRRSWVPRWLFSMKFAIWIAVVLALTSVGGVLVQEFFPVRSQADAVRLAEVLPEGAYRAFMALHLHDPFRAGWFRVLLGLLAASLLVCSLKRFRSALRQATRLRPVREPRTLLMLQSSVALHHVEPALFDAVVGRLRRKLYRGRVLKRDGENAAALHQGGVSRLGPVLLHLGILALVFGGLLSSIVGRRAFVELGPGQTAALPGSHLGLRLDGFRIDTNEQGAVKQYRSQLTVLDGEREVVQREISVNHPLRHAGFNVYQSSYSTDPTQAASLVFTVHAAGGDTPPHGTHAARQGGGERIDAGMQGTHAVPGFQGWTFRVKAFYGHLKLSAQGPVNAKRDLGNPAALLEVLHDGQPAGEQWAFGNFPAHARAELPFVLELRDVEPVLASGLELNTNPGAALVWAGLGLSTLGLVLAFLIQHRCVFLLARPEARGWTLWLAGRSDRERVAFAREFAALVAAARADARRLRAARRDPAPRQAPAPASAGHAVGRAAPVGS